MKIIIESIIEGIASRADGSVVIKVGSQELDSSQVGSLFQLRGKYAKVLISDSNITKLEEDMVDATHLVDSTKKKSKSRRLRDVIFVAHSRNGGSEEDFEAFYNSEMERHINGYKSQFD